jgi:hypothetical protein
VGLIPNEGIFFFNLLNPSFQSRYGPGIYSDSSRNEHQKTFLGVKLGRSVTLTTSLYEPIV